MAKQRILVPFNFTKMDQKALDFVIQIFSIHEDVEITLFHIYTPTPKIETHSSTVMGRLSSSLQYLSGQLREKEQNLKETRRYLLDKGFAEERVDYVFRSRTKPVAEEIIETSINEIYNVVVLNCRPYRITRVFIQSVHNKVVSSLSDVTVCIVT